MQSLPATTPEAVDALQQFLDLVRTQNTPAAQRAQAMALEALADRTTGATQKARARLEAARTYALAGDRASARRMLQMIAGDASSAPAVAAGATSTLIGLLVDEGKIDEASRRLDEFQSTIGVEDYLALRRQVALGWARAGQAVRAEQMLAADSTVEGSAAIGRIRLYAGDLKGAVAAMQAAGPYAGSREEATQRSATLALLQPIQQDSQPALGGAFLQLDRGDTTAALSAFEKVSASLPPAAGGAELRLLVGNLQVARGQLPAAEKSLRAAMVREAPATAAAAALELGRLLLANGRQREATETLEQMILDYPTSALVPQARRLLDQARNAVPQT
jgi:tetratricopeptide (TPR) repeat protein